MTVSSTTTPRKNYAGDDVTVAFPITFEYDADGDVEVTNVAADGTETDWVLDGAGATGYTIANDTVTANTAPAKTTRLVLLRVTEQTQAVDRINNVAESAEVGEDALDRLTFMTQEQERRIDDSVRIGPLVTDNPVLEITELAAGRANKILGFDGDGDISAITDLGSYGGDWATGTAYSGRDFVKDSTTTANVYWCAHSHTSGTLATDVAAGLWELLIEVDDLDSTSGAADAFANKYGFDDSTVMADPGTGEFRLNNAAVASTTAFAINANTLETGNPDISAWVDTWDTTGGTLTLKKAATPATLLFLRLAQQQ